MTTVVAVLIAMVALGASFYAFSHYRRQAAKTVTKKDEAPVAKPQTFLIIGFEPDAAREKATGLFVVRFDTANSEINTILIPGDTFLEVPGQGFEMISNSLLIGVSTVVLTVRNFLGINVDHYVKVSKAVFEKIVGDSDLTRAFKSPSASDLSKAELAKVSKNIASIPPDKQKIIMLPVNKLTVGSETYLEPKNDEVEKLVTLIWGEASIEGKSAPKVIVLNGCGLPGVGSEVSEKLVESGFRVIDIKNADNFDHEQTEIISYDPENKEDTARIRRTLGVGVILYNHAPQQLVDITVIIGKDFKPEKAPAEEGGSTTGRP